MRDARAAGVAVALVRVPFADHAIRQIAAKARGNRIGRPARLRFV